MRTQASPRFRLIPLTRGADRLAPVICTMWLLDRCLQQRMSCLISLPDGAAYCSDMDTSSPNCRDICHAFWLLFSLRIFFFSPDTNQILICFMFMTPLLLHCTGTTVDASNSFSAYKQAKHWEFRFFSFSRTRGLQWMFFRWRTHIHLREATEFIEVSFPVMLRAFRT